jgi:hypothetical protein
VRVIDRFITLNASPELTCIIALRLYRVILRVHSRFPGRKDYLKERFELTEAANAVAGLMDNEEREAQLLDTASTASRYTHLLSYMKGENE